MLNTESISHNHNIFLASFAVPVLKDIHLSDYGASGAIRIKCDQSWGRAAWFQTPGLPDGVYELEDGRLYTFDDDKITCQKCDLK